MSRLKVLSKLSKEMPDVKRYMIILGLLKAFSLICGLMPLFLYSFFVNKVLLYKCLGLLSVAIIGYLAVYILDTVGVAHSKRFLNLLHYKFDIRIKNTLMKKYFGTDSMLQNIGDAKSRIESDSVIAENFFSSHIVDYVYSIVYAVVLASVLVFYDWKIALISFVFIPIALVAVNVLGDKTKKTGEELRELQTQYESFLHNSFQNWKDIKINNLENSQLEELDKYLKKIRRIWFINQFYMHIGVTCSFFAKNFITQLFIYFIGGLFVIKGYSQVGTLLVFTRFYGQFFECIQNISNSIMNYKKDSVSIQKVMDVLEYRIDARPYKKINGSDIVVNSLCYSYNENDMFSLDDVSFTVEKGEHLAIVGESGCGKSTLTRLLIGQMIPRSGTVCIGGININSVNSKSVFEKISIIVQEPILFNMTIRDNLLLAKANATDEELISCCMRAGIYDFIKELPDKLETIIGEKGVKFSGGQKQRLSIARAFLQDRDILIFDESTSALDSEKERDIISEIEKIAPEKTIVSVAHRLSAIVSCNKVMIMKNGKIVAIDTHENLRKNNETYDLLFKQQYIAG